MVGTTQHESCVVLLGIGIFTNCRYLESEIKEIGIQEMDNILDYHLIHEKDKTIVNSINEQLLENEKLIWTGKPKYEFGIIPLEIGGYDVALGPTNLYFIALGLNWFYSFKTFSEGQIVKSIFFFILGLALFSLPDIIKEIRRRNTYYAVSNNRIFFKLWGLRKSKRIITHFKIDLINDLRYEA